MIFKDVNNMETNINIAEILKDKPQGTKLHDLLYNIEVELDTISTTDTEIVVWCTNETDNNTTCHRGYSEFGTVRGCHDGLQILLPSKEMRDWSKFAWKKGDVLVNKIKTIFIIFEGFEDDNYTTFKGKHCLTTIGNEKEYTNKESNFLVSLFDKAKEDDAQTYIKRLGGKLNLDTLEIEKQYEFKDGDIVVYKCEIEDVPDVIFIFRGIDQLTPYYSYYASLDSDGFLSYKLGAFGIYNRELRLATEEEKQQLFDALAKEGKAWDAKKKQVVDLKPKVRFKPFDKVVAYCEIANEWSCDIFSHYAKNYEDKEVITCLGGGTYYKALPYNEETAKLLGTTKDVEG